MTAYDLAIIGAGPAGLAAANASAGAGVKRIALIDRSPALGGILPQCLHRGFGLHEYGKELTGPQYAAALIEKLAFRSIDVWLNTAVARLDANGIATIASGANGVRQIAPEAVILATGCRERPIGHLPVYGTRPAGVYTAGSAQKMMNCSGYRIGKTAMILGSGDVGMIVAHHLASSGANVLAVLEKEDHLGGLKRNKALYLDPHGIPLQTRRTVTHLFGASRLEAVTVCDVDDAGSPLYSTAQRVACDTLVTSVGLIPELELTDGWPKIPPWLFIAGNAKHVHSLVDSVVEEGKRAGILAAAYLESL